MTDSDLSKLNGEILYWIIIIELHGELESKEIDDI